MGNRSFESARAAKDCLTVDLDDSFWKAGSGAFAELDCFGQVVPEFRTEIRSRWTENNLYFLFVCPYQALSLNPRPQTDQETNRLWDWDVAEAFIGSDFEKIERYKEFELSPQGEWVDLEIDLGNSRPEDGWRWRSGMRVTASVDPSRKLWVGAMSIPFKALGSSSPAEGDQFRANFFWSQRQGAKVAWQPTFSDTFHVPERFGLLRLVTHCD